eukprot:930881-Rhodomonas_salina.1
MFLGACNAAERDIATNAVSERVGSCHRCRSTCWKLACLPSPCPSTTTSALRTLPFLPLPLPIPLPLFCARSFHNPNDSKDRTSAQRGWARERRECKRERREESTRKRARGHGFFRSKCERKEEEAGSFSSVGRAVV